MVKERVFEVFPLHGVVDITPIPPETKVVPPSGGLNAETSAVPGCAMSAAEMTATNWRLLTNVVKRNEPFQLTKASRRKSLPFTVSRNWLPPAVAFAGEMEATDGNGGHVPQDKAETASVIANAANTGTLPSLPSACTSGRLADEKRGAATGIREDRQD